jgi:hypothetical protein
MDYLITLDDSVSNTYRAFTSPEYWQDLVKVHADNALTELTHFASDPGGTSVIFTHTMTKEQLPPIIAALVPLRLTVTREQHWDPFDTSTNSAQGRYAARVPGGPLDFRGTYALTATDSGSQLELQSECKVKIPLVGGKIEELLLNGLRNLFDGERDFTIEWIRNHS